MSQGKEWSLSLFKNYLKPLQSMRLFLSTHGNNFVRIWEGLYLVLIVGLWYGAFFFFSSQHFSGHGHLFFFLCWNCNAPESESLSVMYDSLQPHQLYSPWNSLVQNTGVSSLSLPQGIFPIQGSTPGLWHWRQILYQLSHKGRPRILEWVAYPFSSGSSLPRNWTGVSCITGRLFTNWAIREAHGPQQDSLEAHCIIVVQQSVNIGFSQI